MGGDVGVESPRKKVKIIKDAPVFTRGATRGEVRYAPFVYLPTTSESDDDDDDGYVPPFSTDISDLESDTDMFSSNTGEDGYKTLKNNLQAYHDQFKVYPRQEDVGEYPRFIPYNSERRIFADATGRDFFEGMSDSTSVQSDLVGDDQSVVRWLEVMKGALMESLWVSGCTKSYAEGPC